MLNVRQYEKITRHLTSLADKRLSSGHPFHAGSWANFSEIKIMLRIRMFRIAGIV
jgi:hypothetical protein